MNQHKKFPQKKKKKDGGRKKGSNLRLPFLRVKSQASIKEIINFNRKCDFR